MTRIAAVTGSNKGIGFAIVRNLALQYPSSPLNNGPLLIYLTARDQSRGQAALQAIHSDEQLKTAKALRTDGGATDVQYHQLDISSSDSISDFASFLKKQHPEGIDILVNNAGIALDGFDGSVVKQTLACNYYGTLQFTQAMLPHIKKDGRVVNVSSMAGKLNKYSPEITAAFKNAKTVEEVTKLMRGFQESVDKGTQSQDGWPSTAYSASKAGVTGMTRALAAEQKAAGNGALINCCCPGYISTDMTKQKGRHSPDKGAQTPVKLAVGDIGGTTGEFWEHEEISQW